MKQIFQTHLNRLLLCLLFALTGGGNFAWGDTVTYRFTSKDWNATSNGVAANWISGKDGNQLTSTQGIQVTSGVSGANATSPVSFDNISEIEIQYCTNKSSGAGTIKVQVGDNTEQPFSVTKPSSDDGTTLKTATFNYEPTETGSVKVTVDCSTNSVYVYSVKITYSPSSSAVATTTTIDASGITNTDFYKSTAAGSLSATVKDADENDITGATVTWSTDNDKVATIDETGAVTLVSAGTVTFTASYAGVADEYQASSDTYEMNVTSSAPYVQPTEFDIALNDGFFGTSYGGTASGITDNDPVSGTLNRVTVTYAGSGNHYINASQIRFYPNNKLTFEAPEGYNIVEIIFTSVTPDGTWAATISANEGTYTSDSKTWVGEATSVLFTGSGSSRCDMSTASITLEAIVPKVLSSIALSGDYPTTFHQGDAFSHEGLTVTATYEGGKTADVTESATFSGYDMDAIGDQEVTVRYTENEVTKTATYDITVKAPATLESIALSGDYPTEFEQGDEFSSGDIVVKANWSDETTSIVTEDATFTGYDMSSLGEQTVTVSYGGKTATYNITVNVKKGTEKRPYTVAEAIAATPSSGTSANVYIHGIVSAFYKTSIVDDGSSYRYYISDDGTTNNQLLVYKGTGLGEAAFSSADDLYVGDEVTIVGGLTTYNSTKEVASGNYLVSRKTTPGIAWSETEFEASLGGSNTFPILTNTNSVAVTYSSTDTDVATIASDGTIILVAAGETTIKATFAGNASYLAQEVSYVLTVVDPTAATIELSSYSIDATAAETDGTLTATYNYITEVVAEVQFCDAEGNAAEYDWIVAEINSSNNVDYTIEANEGPARTAYFRVYALDDNADNVYSDIVTVTQAAPVVDYATLPFTFNSGRSAIDGTTGLTYSGLGTDYSTSVKLKFDSTGDYVVLEIGEAPGTLSFDVQGNGFSGGTFYVQTSSDGETYKNLDKVSITGSVVRKSYADLDQDARYIKWIYTEKSSGNVGMGNISLTAAGNTRPITVTNAGYATYCCNVALDFTDSDIKAYVGTRSGDNLTFTRIKKVPARTGLLLVYDGGTEEDVPVLTTDPETVTNNCLTGVTEFTQLTVNDYILNVVEGEGAGFFKAGTGHTKLKANRAYIPASVGAGVKSFVLDFEDDADGIKTLSDSPLKGENIYNLAGQRLSKMQKGINIVNGKKILK